MIIFICMMYLYGFLLQMILFLFLNLILFLAIGFLHFAPDYMPLAVFLPIYFQLVELQRQSLSLELYFGVEGTWINRRSKVGNCEILKHH